jgi:hypothetical protein
MRLQRIDSEVNESISTYHNQIIRGVRNLNFCFKRLGGLKVEFQKIETFYNFHMSFDLLIEDAKSFDFLKKMSFCLLKFDHFPFKLLDALDVTLRGTAAATVRSNTGRNINRIVTRRNENKMP